MNLTSFLVTIFCDLNNLPVGIESIKVWTERQVRKHFTKQVVS